MFLLDTVVLSELRKKEKNAGVRTWIRQRSDYELFISAVSIGEVQRGIKQQEHKDAVFASKLSLWLDEILRTFSARIIPVDAVIALQWGTICNKTGNASVDNMIAATALVHRLTIVTRNIKHFEVTGAICINPWSV